MTRCKFCARLPHFIKTCIDTEYAFDKAYTEDVIVSGGWTEIIVGVDEQSNIYLYASGDGDTDKYYPKYCPECGRKLNDI